jgi:uncharacterized protein YcaQ
MRTVKLTKPEVRKIILFAAGLSKRAQFGRGKEGVYKTIDHLGFVQVDTNYVVERAHHHQLWSRVPDYKTEWLDDLQSESRIYEFWTRDSGFMPMHEFRFSYPVKNSWTEHHKVTPTDQAVMRKVLDRISREGPMKASDFENDRVTKSKGWWDWRPSKLALERLHLRGQIVNTRTKNFHKLYDLTDNVIPSSIDRTVPTSEEYARHIIRRTLGSLGVAYLNEIAWSGRLVKGNLIKAEIKKMNEEGEVTLVEIDGLKGPIYALTKYLDKKINVTGELFILSPFDILNVFRRRLRDFFDFDYQIECFVPAPKRKYGYFSLPILAGDTFIARMDSKAERKEKVLTVYNLHFEDVRLTKDVISKLAAALKAFANFNQCTSIRIEKCNDKKALKQIRSDV